MTAAQRKIDLETDAMSVMGLLDRHEYDGCKMQFTEGAIAYHLGWFLPKAINHGRVQWPDRKRVRWAVRKLLAMGWIYQAGGGRKKHYKKIDSAEHEYRQACGAPAHRTGQAEADFRNEALTGTKKNGGPSPLKYEVEPKDKGGITIKLSELEPCLPSRESPSPLDPEDYCATFMALRYIALQFGISKDQAADHISSGKIHICNNGEPHLGMFHKRTRGGWRNRCIVCRKRERES